MKCLSVLSLNNFSLSALCSKNMKDRLIFLLMLFLPLLILTSSPAKALLVEKTVQKLSGKEDKAFLSLLEIKNFQALIRLKLLQPSLLSESYTCLTKSRACVRDFLIQRSLLGELPQMKQLPPPSDQAVEEAIEKLKGKLSNRAFLKRLKRAGWDLPSFKQAVRIDLKNHYFLQGFFSNSGLSPSDRELLDKAPSINKVFEYEFVSLSFSSDQKQGVLSALRKNRLKGALEDFALKLGLETKAFRLLEHELGREFRQALEKLSVSQSSPLLYIGDRYYLLQLKWKRVLISDQEVKLRLENLLREQKVKLVMSRWLREKRASLFLLQ